MSIESRSRQYGVIFGHWQITKRLGAGSGGRTAVFQLRRTDGFSDTSALKVINLIEEQGQLDEMSEDRRRDYENARNASSIRAAREVELMAELQSETNIVDYKDHGMVDWEDENGFGRDMLIRMELLEDLRSSIRSKGIFSEEQILHVGRDICRALILCHKKHILHRDIKPENIFVNKDGNYKLGDFGVSRILHAAPSAVADTGVGTPEYAAPEQFSGTYDTRVDIYSLGLVLYELSNRNRLPFAQSSYVRPEDVQKRQLAVTLPSPSDAGDGLTAVILKACAHRPEDRFQTAEEFLHALQDPQRFFYENNPQGNQTVRAEAERKQNIPRSDWERGSEESKRGQEKQGNQDTFGKIIRLLAVLAAALVLAAVVLWVGGRPSDASDETTEPSEFFTNDPASEVRSYCAQLAEQGDYLEAVQYTIGKMKEIPGLEPVLQEYELLLEQSVLTEAQGYADAGQYRLAIKTIWDAADSYAFPTYQDTAGSYMTQLASQTQIAAGREHTVRRFTNGRVAAVGREYDGQCDVGNWVNVKAIAAGDHHTVGLLENGTVLAVGKNTLNQCEVSGWTNVKLIAAGDYHTLALTNEGMLLAAGMNNEGQSNVTGLWGNTPIVSMAAGYFHTVVLYADGTVTAIGDNSYGQCNVYGWTDIVAVYAGTYHTLGLRADGTVVAAGNNEHGECDVQYWENMDALGTGDYFSIGLSADGTVAVCGETNYGQYGAAQWTDICAVAGGRYHIIGMCSDGTLVYAGDNPVGQCDIHRLAG